MGKDEYHKVGDRYKVVTGYHEGQPLFQWMPEGWKPEPDDNVIEAPGPK